MQEYILFTLFDVTRLEVRETMNIRARPDAEIIGVREQDARVIEVVAEARSTQDTAATEWRCAIFTIRQASGRLLACRLACTASEPNHSGRCGQSAMS